MLIHDLRNEIERQEFVLKAFMQKRPLEINERVFAPNAGIVNEPHVVASIDEGNGTVELLLHGNGTERPRGWTQPQWAVCRWQDAMSILRRHCKSVIAFDGKPE